MKKFIIAVIVLIAVIFIFRWVTHRNYNYEVANGGYNNSPAYHESVGNGIVHSVIKGAVEGYVAGKVINHGMRKAQTRQYNSYGSNYNNYGSNYNNDHYNSYHSSYHSSHFGHRR